MPAINARSTTYSTPIVALNTSTIVAFIVLGLLATALFSTAIWLLFRYSACRGAARRASGVRAGDDRDLFASRDRDVFSSRNRDSVVRMTLTPAVARIDDEEGRVVIIVTGPQRKMEEKDIAEERIAATEDKEEDGEETVVGGRVEGETVAAEKGVESLGTAL